MLILMYVYIYIYILSPNNRYTFIYTYKYVYIYYIYIYVGLQEVAVVVALFPQTLNQYCEASSNASFAFTPISWRGTSFLFPFFSLNGKISKEIYYSIFLKKIKIFFFLSILYQRFKIKLIYK